MKSEVMYKRSSNGGTDGAFQVWIDNQLAIDEKNVETWETGFTRFEAYWKLYGSPNKADWNPQTPHYFIRNIRVADGKLSDGNPGNPSAP